MPVEEYNLGGYAIVTVETDDGVVTCTCPELDPHPVMNISEGANLPCEVTRYIYMKFYQV